MAKIKYTGPVNPLSIPGVGKVGKEFVSCPDAIAEQFKNEPGFEVELSAASSASSADKKKSGGKS